MRRGYIFNPCKIFIFTQWYSTGGFYIWYDINCLIRSKLLKQVGIFKQSWCISYQRDVPWLYLKSNSDISSYLQLSGYIKCKHSINITYTHTYIHTHTHTHVLILILILMGVGGGGVDGAGWQSGAWRTTKEIKLLALVSLHRSRYLIETYKTLPQKYNPD